MLTPGAVIDTARHSHSIAPVALPTTRTIRQARSWLFTTLLLAAACRLTPAQSLPEAPSAILTAALQTPTPQPPPVSTGMIEGTVTDPAGDAIIGAEVHLSGSAIPTERSMETDDEGCFHFHAVPPGPFAITASMQGFSPATSTGTLAPGQQMQLPDLALPVATAQANVQVTLTLHDEAEAEMKDEETQRIGGFLPNFYVTYNWHAAPLTTGEKYRLAWHNLYDPVNQGINLIFAGVQQAQDDLPGYRQGAAGYGKRFGANTADFVIGSMLGGAVFPSILHQDPRYFYKGTGSKVSRLLYALAAAGICRGDNGKWQPNYSSVLGDLSSGAASNLYYPSTNRTGLGLTFENGGIAVISDAVNNLLEEFVFRKVTPHAPTYRPAPVTVPTQPAR